MADLKYSKEYRELEFMVMRYNTLMAELKAFGQSRRSIYHKKSDNFETDSLKQNESQKEALEIQKAEIMTQLTKIREFVYVNGGCPDEDLLPLMPESQRKKHRESTSSISSITSITSISSLPDLKATYYPPQPCFGPFNKSLKQHTDNNMNTITKNTLKNDIIKIQNNFKNTLNLNSISKKTIPHITTNTHTNTNTNNRHDTPVPTKSKKNKHLTSNIIAAFSAPQHLKKQSILKENSLSNLTLKHNMSNPPSTRSHSTTSVSIQNSTTTEEVADIVEIKLDVFHNPHESDTLDTDSDLSHESDTLFPLTITKTDPNLNHMSLRAQLWSVLLDFNFKEHQHKEYIREIEKGNSTHYNSKILRDAQRTFLTSSDFNSRVSEHQIVRILNAFVIKNDRAYCQGMDAIAGIMLYVMHETYAFQLLNVLMSVHFPLYFKSEKDNLNSLIGAYAGTFLAYDILKIWDMELWTHLSELHPYQYFFPLIASFQAISQPLAQVQRLWDYLFAYGVYLNPIVSVAQLIVNRKKILNEDVPTLLMGLLSQRKWMNGRLNAKNVIKVSSLIANKLCASEEYAELWMNVQLHSSEFGMAYKIKERYDLRLKIKFKFGVGHVGIGGVGGEDDNGYNCVNCSSSSECDCESSDWNRSDTSECSSSECEDSSEKDESEISESEGGDDDDDDDQECD